MAFFTQFFFAKMILNDSLSLNLKTKLISEAYDKGCELF